MIEYIIKIKDISEKLSYISEKNGDLKSKTSEDTGYSISYHDEHMYIFDDETFIFYFSTILIKSSYDLYLDIGSTQIRYRRNGMLLINDDLFSDIIENPEIFFLKSTEYFLPEYKDLNELYEFCLYCIGKKYRCQMHFKTFSDFYKLETPYSLYESILEETINGC